MRAWLRGLPARRRAFVGGLAALIAAAVVAVAVTVAVHLAGDRSPAALPAQDRPGPVLLVPGYGGSTTSLRVLGRRIAATGRAVTVLRLPGDGTGSLSQVAAEINAVVTRLLHQGAPSVDIIGYSAGGVATLLWARTDDGIRKARRVVTLGSPFHGTLVAGSAAGVAPGACPTACQQLVPGSSLLAGLAGGAPAGLRWLSLWTTGDTTVSPPDSARLAGATDVPVQSVCPRERITHSQLPTNRAVAAMVLRAIGAGPAGRPRPADCPG
jgi:triacylglycerol esterase/lipase EstA (alpha/beta hydrolase family)